MGALASRSRCRRAVSQPDPYDPSAFTPFGVTVDIVLLVIVERLSVMLIRRGVEPFIGKAALPGGFVMPQESIEEAARRELVEETGIAPGDLPGTHLEQLATFGGVDRDPRMRVVTVAYLGLTRLAPTPTAGTDAAVAEWVPVAAVDAGDLAFDHARILTTALERARSKLEYTTLATALVDTEFTLGDLHRTYEITWDTKLDLGNFRRKVLATNGFVIPTGKKTVPAGGGAPAALYRAGNATMLSPPIMRSR